MKFKNMQDHVHHLPYMLTLFKKLIFSVYVFWESYIVNLSIMFFFIYLICIMIN